MTHTRMQMMMSFIAGLMLGVSFFHLLPHAIEEMHSVDDAVLWMTGGFVAMLLMLRAFHFHQHEPVPLDAGHGHEHAGHSHAGHEHHAGHDHFGHGGRPRMNWIGIAIGMSIHTLIDGVALAANVVAETEEVGPHLLVGMGTFLAIALHKPLDSLSITSIMTAGGWSVAARNWANVVFSLMCPLGCAVFVLGIHQVVERQHVRAGSRAGFVGRRILVHLGGRPDARVGTALARSLSAIAGVAAGSGAGLRGTFDRAAHMSMSLSLDTRPRRDLPRRRNGQNTIPQQRRSHALRQWPLREPPGLFALSRRLTKCRFNVGTERHVAEPSHD